jgi:2-polyprenyl-3-methyl-5-hydroxy-6-metoxy-1,4-benzoquinol methylase
MHGMALKGWQAEGIEPSEKASHEAASLGHKIHTGFLEDAPDPIHKFDLVVGWMVLEHLHDPLRCLMKLYLWTKPGSWLVLSVPNIESLDFRLFRKNWYALQLPIHLFHFSPYTLKKLLRRAGWRSQRIYHQRNLSNYFVSLGNVIPQYVFRKRLTRWLQNYPSTAGHWHNYLFPLSMALSALGQTGRITVWARRCDD